MGKHFISVLGTGRYSETVYFREEKESTTPYIQEASIQLFFGKVDKNDRITILMTEKAKEAHWIRRDDDCGLEKRLEMLIGFPPECIIIKEGATEQELWDAFQKMYVCIEEGEEVYCDITHGLRNIPLQLITVLNYARVLKQIKIASITYGAYEMKNKNGKTPVFDLSLYNDIMEWTSAAEIFLKAGNGLPLFEVYEQKKSFHAKAKDELAQPLMQVKNMMESIKWLTGCIDTSRGKILDDGKRSSVKKSIHSSSSRFIESYSEITDIDELKPFEPVLAEIKKTIEALQNDSATDVGLAVVQWCIDRNLTQQGFTALEETMKTFICECFQLDKDMEVVREAVVKRALMTINTCYIDGVEREERYRSWVSEINQKIQIDQRKLEQLYFSIPKEWCNLSANVSEYRNDINHFGYRKNPKGYDSLKQKLKEFHQKFVQISKLPLIEYHLVKKDEVFLNFTNHPSNIWGEQQLEAAKKYGKLIDLAFPKINPEMDEEKLRQVAEQQLERIESYYPTTVLCQGESVICNYIVNKLKQKGIKVVAACSERNAEEIAQDDVSLKNSVFKFVQFREYI